MLDLGGRDPSRCPTRFQECVIFHFLLTGNRRGRQRWPPRRGERRASLSGGAALKEFRDSSAPWRPITPLCSQVPSNRASDNARQASAIDLPGWLPRNELCLPTKQIAPHHTFPLHFHELCLKMTPHNIFWSHGRTESLAERANEGASEEIVSSTPSGRERRDPRHGRRRPIPPWRRRSRRCRHFSRLQQAWPEPEQASGRAGDGLTWRTTLTSS